MADRPPLHDYARSRAVVMGTWDYDFLEPVPAVENSMRRMEELLTDSLCGWPREKVLVLANEPSPGNLPDQLITAFDGVSDVAVFYYVGHGQIDSRDQLCLGLVQSRKEANRRAATSLQFADVRRALQDCGAAIKIAILDCCFAGLATMSSLAGNADRVLDLIVGTGAYTMAATSAYATAWYEDSPGPAKPQTYFTKYLVDLIESGIPGQPSLLRLDLLFNALQDNLAADQRPVPQKRAVNDARDFVFAYNAAPPQTHRDHVREVAQLTRRLAESDAEIQALKAEAARLKNLMANARPHTVEQRRQLQNRIDQATRELDDARAALPQADKRRADATSDPTPPSHSIFTTAEWALWGWKKERTARLLGCSDGLIGPQAFEKALTRFSPGRPRISPQTAISWLREAHQDFVGLAIYEKPDDYFDSAGRPIARIRSFYVPYAQLADGNVPYKAIYDHFCKTHLPAPKRGLIASLLQVGDPMTSIEDGAMVAAAMLMTGRPVCILDADQIDIGKRLQYLDSIASFLPYGMRARLSASTWADNNSFHSFRLFFAEDLPPQRPDVIAVAWGETARPSIDYPHAREYLSWLRNEDAGRRIQQLAAETAPIDFRATDLAFALEHIGVRRPATIADKTSKRLVGLSNSLDELSNNRQSAQEEARSSADSPILPTYADNTTIPFTESARKAPGRTASNRQVSNSRPVPRVERSATGLNHPVSSSRTAYERAWRDAEPYIRHKPTAPRRNELSTQYQDHSEIDHGFVVKVTDSDLQRPRRKTAPVPRHTPRHRKVIFIGTAIVCGGALVITLTIHGGSGKSPGNFATRTPASSRSPNAADTAYWIHDTKAAVESDPAVAAGIVYVGSDDGKVYALDAATGHIRWTHTTGGKVLSSPAVTGRTVYVGSLDGKVYALDMSGHIRWTHTTDGEIASSPAVTGGTVYVSSNDGGGVYALDAATGHIRWSHPIGEVVSAGPTVKESTVYVGTTDGKVYALDAATGYLHWTRTTRGEVASRPAVTGGVVYVGSDDGKVYALDAATGHIRWTHATGGKVVSGPAVAADIIYVGSDDGKVYAWRAGSQGVRRIPSNG